MKKQLLATCRECRSLESVVPMTLPFVFSYSSLYLILGKKKKVYSEGKKNFANLGALVFTRQWKEFFFFWKGFLKQPPGLSGTQNKMKVM